MYSLIILLHLVSTSVKKLSRSSSNDLNNVFKADFNQSSSMRMYSESHLPLPYELRFEQVHQTLGGRLGEYCFWYRLYEKPQQIKEKNAKQNCQREKRSNKHLFSNLIKCNSCGFSR